MAKKKPVQSEELDFETGGQVHTEIGRYAEAQARLFSVPNPYVGNKRAIITDIGAALDDHGVKYESVLDLFGGSGVVSLFMKLIGKRVTYNDLLTSSYLNAVSFVENNSIELHDFEIAGLLSKGWENRDGSFVRDHWSDRFTADEAARLDGYRNAIGGWEIGKIPSADATKKALAYTAMLHYVMDHCFIGGRLNKGQILAKLDHRLEHQRNDGHEMKFAIKPPQLFRTATAHAAHNMDAVELLSAVKPEADLLYMDPPYGSSQSDYAQMFRFCEEYVHGARLEDLPHVQTASKRFVQSKGYEGHFRELLSLCGSYGVWAVSYSDASFGTAEQIASILGEYKKNVTTVNIDHEYRYRKRDAGATSKVTEYLFIARD